MQNGPGRMTDRLGQAVIVAAALLAMFSIARPYLDWDAWAYHLPFASFLWDIGGGRESFQLCPRNEFLYQGYPLAGAFFQGMFWKATGWLGTTLIPQYVAFAGFLYLSKRWFGVRTDLFLLACFSSPLLLIHFMASYEDLLAASLCGLQLLLAARILTADSFRLRSAIAFWYIVCLAVLAAIKYPAYLVGLLSLGILCAILLLRRRALIQVTFLFLIGLIAANFVEIKNYLVFGNPFYPLNIELMGHQVFPGPWLVRPWYPGYADGAQPLYFVLSLSELDWVKRGVTTGYSIDNFFGDQPLRYSPARTGGLWDVYVWLQFLVLGYQLLRFRTLDREQRALLFVFLPLLVAAAFLPRSHELRLWLFIPLIASLLNVRYLSKLSAFDPIALRAALMTMVAASAFIVVQEFGYAPTPDKSHAFKNSTDTTKQFRYEGQLGFMYSRAITGQNVLLVPGDCK